MGNMCSQKQENAQVYKGAQKNKDKIKGTMNISENERILEIREFLTLTCQNTQSFYNGQLSKCYSIQKRKLAQFKVVRGLGKGAFGQVFMVKDTLFNKFYAMKIISKDKIKTEQQKIHTLSQRYILQAMDNPFIVKLHYAFQTGNKLYLLVDLMPGGELFYLLRKNQKFPEEVCKFYLAELILALEYLHSRNIIYRDLKPQNILLDNQGHIKLTDFGLSKVCYTQNQMTYSICGTPEYIAPEVIQGKGYNQSADWFSFGSLMYDMMTGKPPFYSKNKHQMLKKITSKIVPIPENLSKNAKSLLQSLLKIKPKERIGYQNGAKQIKNHPFFSDVNFEEMMHKRVKPPMTFKESHINEQGFDQNMKLFSNNSLLNQNTLKEQGIGFDGFTYYRQEIVSPKQQLETKENNQQNVLSFE